MSNRTCGNCDHYDPILRGVVPTSMGWCSKKSVYPALDGPGQVTPAGVERVEDPTEPAKPRIVEAKQEQPNCTLYQIKKTKPSKATLMAAALQKPLEQKKA